MYKFLFKPNKLIDFNSQIVFSSRFLFNSYNLLCVVSLSEFLLHLKSPLIELNRLKIITSNSKHFNRKNIHGMRQMTIILISSFFSFSVCFCFFHPIYLICDMWCLSHTTKPYLHPHKPVKLHIITCLVINIHNFYQFFDEKSMK